MILRILLLFSLTIFNDGQSEDLDECCGKCIGSANCTACTSCNYCKYCNSGGSCGVCGGGSSSSTVSSYRSTLTLPWRSAPSPKTGTRKSSSTSSYNAQYFVNVNQLNVRSGPNTSYSVIDKIDYLTPVTISKVYSNGWCLIAYYSEYVRYGYVPATYLSVK